VAKKKTASRSKKKTSSKPKAASKKKAARKTARASSGKKKASASRQTTRKPSKKKATRKASSKKKTTRKKAVTRKKATSASSRKSSKKKAASKKAAPRKPATKKASKASSGKKSGLKRAPKKSAAKPASKKSADSKPAATAGKGAKSAKSGKAAKAKAEPKPRARDERHTLTDARAAASSLAARAGLKINYTSAEVLPADKAKTRKLKKSPLNKTQLDKFRQILLEKRSEVSSDVTAIESEAFGPTDGGAFPQHLADQGSDEYDQSLSLGLAESQRKLLAEINEALQRIDQGVYGICEITGGPIGLNRLNATPWAKLSVEGARELDRQRYFH